MGEDQHILRFVLGFNPFDPTQDTERYSVVTFGYAARGFNPFDPTQDTERSAGSTVLDGGSVSTHSIRHRILKVILIAIANGFSQSFNPFDPTQDTESCRGYPLAPRTARFQPIRSDTGY